MEKLNELLNNLVAEKSLSFEVLDQLKKVKTESEELIVVNQSLGEQVVKLTETVREEQSKTDQLMVEVGTWQHRESELKSRENAVLDIEHKNEIANLKQTGAEITLNQVKEIVGLVFKNISIKKNVFSSEPVIKDGYSTGSTLNKSSNETTTED